MQKLEFPEIKTYPIYKLVNGGETIHQTNKDGSMKEYKVHHISETGIMCDDLETFIEWEKFSK